MLELLILITLFIGAIIDYNHQIIPNYIVILIGILSILKTGAILVPVFLFYIVFLYLLSKISNLGGGDIKLFSALSLGLGFSNTYILLLLVYIVFFIIGKLFKKEKLAMCPFIFIVHTLLLIGGIYA